MKVEDGLSRAGTDVQDSPISLLNLALSGDLSCRQMTPANNLGIGAFRFLQTGKMPFRDDENVRRRLRIDVFEREYVFVFKNFLRRNLSADDAAKEAILIACLCHCS